MKSTTKKNNRRYKLHQRIKKMYNYSSKNKTIYVPHGIVSIEDRYACELRDKYHYTIQLQII